MDIMEKRVGQFNPPTLQILNERSKGFSVELRKQRREKITRAKRMIYFYSASMGLNAHLGDYDNNYIIKQSIKVLQESNKIDLINSQLQVLCEITSQKEYKPHQNKEIARQLFSTLVRYSTWIVPIPYRLLALQALSNIAARCEQPYELIENFMQIQDLLNLLNSQNLELINYCIICLGNFVASNNAEIFNYLISNDILYQLQFVMTKIRKLSIQVKRNIAWFVSNIICSEQELPISYISNLGSIWCFLVYCKSQVIKKQALIGILEYTVKYRDYEIAKLFDYYFTECIVDQLDSSIIKIKHLTIKILINVLQIKSNQVLQQLSQLPLFDKLQAIELESIKGKKLVYTLLFNLIKQNIWTEQITNHTIFEKVLNDMNHFNLKIKQLIAEIFLEIQNQMSDNLLLKIYQEIIFRMRYLLLDQDLIVQYSYLHILHQLLHKGKTISESYSREDFILNYILDCNYYEILQQLCLSSNQKVQEKASIITKQYIEIYSEVEIPNSHCNTFNF